MTRKRILVVDDDPSTRFLLRLIFETGGYEVIEAQNGIAALIWIKETLPDIVVTDMMMPVMDGPSFRAAQRAAIETARIPIIVLSATHEVQGRAAALDAAAIFAKPFDLGDLLDAIARLVTDAARGALPT